MKGYLSAYSVTSYPKLDLPGYRISKGFMQAAPYPRRLAHTDDWEPVGVRRGSCETTLV